MFINRFIYIFVFVKFNVLLSSWMMLLLKMFNYKWLLLEFNVLGDVLNFVSFYFLLWKKEYLDLIIFGKKF